jgi:two-component system response regulator YesN
LEGSFLSGATEEIEQHIQEWFRSAYKEKWFITDVHSIGSRLLRRLLNSFTYDQLELLELQHLNASQWVAKRRTADRMKNDLLELLLRIVTQTQHYVGNVHSLVAKVQAIIERDYGVPELSIVQLAGELHMSASHLSAVFKKRTGKPFTQYITDVRLEKARELVYADRLKAYEVAAAVGYRNEKAFSRAFRRKFGVSPQNYKKQTGLR